MLLRVGVTEIMIGQNHAEGSTDVKVGLLINFGRDRVEFKRLVH